MDHRIIIEFYARGEADQVTFILTQPNSNFFLLYIKRDQNSFIEQRRLSFFIHATSDYHFNDS